MPKQKSTHKHKSEDIGVKEEEERFKEVELTDILSRFEAKRSRRHTQQEEKTGPQSAQKRQFYSEEDDELWARYFHGTTPAKEQTETVTVNDIVTDTVVDTVKVLEERKVLTKPEQVTRFKKPTEIKQQPATLDATHTTSEAVLYSLMYRETISKGNSEGYFSVRRLMKLSGLNSPNTVRKALAGLIEKRSIELAESMSNSPLGSRYRIFHPRDIFSLRGKEQIKIDSHTKKVLSKKHLSVSVSVSSSVTKGESKIDTPTISRNDTVTVSKIDTHNTLNKNKYTNDSYESSSNKKKDDTDDEVFSHRVYVISLYEKYTGNQWRVGDNEFYESENLKDILPEIVEAAIIASVLRSKTKINSFAYCEGAIHEFQENLPLGYLSYLREKWRERKGRGREESDSG